MRAKQQLGSNKEADNSSPYIQGLKLLQSEFSYRLQSLQDLLSENFLTDLLAKTEQKREERSKERLKEYMKKNYRVCPALSALRFITLSAQSAL